jgi:nucleoside-diphosphate-sugar epimerase
MQFTVLGASGFIGSHLASRLVEDGHRVLRASRRDFQSLARRELGHVFYCIGEDDIKENPHNAFDAHIGRLSSVLRYNNFTSLTYLSSTRVYFGAPSASEESALHILPNDDNAVFSVMKIAGEQLCFACKKATVRVIRLSSVIGFAPKGKNLIPRLINDAFLRGRMRLTISPQSSRDYIAVEDVIDILPRIAIEGRHRCYNVASGVNVQLAEIIRLIGNEFPSQCDCEVNAPTVEFPVIDTSRIRTEFSFSPRPALDALTFTCAEFRRSLKPALGTQDSILSRPIIRNA